MESFSIGLLGQEDSGKEVGKSEKETIFSIVPYLVLGWKELKEVNDNVLPILLILALDHPIRLEMIRLLKEIRNEFNLPVVLVTHDVLEAYTMADKIIVYSGGKIARTGFASEIFQLPVGLEADTFWNSFLP